MGKQQNRKFVITREYIIPGYDFKNSYSDVSIMEIALSAQ